VDSELVSIEQFIERVLHKPPFTTVMEQWPVEPEAVVQILANTFHEMGIYTIQTGQRRFFSQIVMDRLKASPEIKRLIFKAEEEQRMRPKSRHAG